MTENVILTVRGHQTDLGEDATTELIAGAAYYYRNGKHYILYDEIDPESGEQSGNTIKIGEDRVDVIRRGAGKVHMVFEKEKQISSQYHTPAGVIQMEIFTSRLQTRQEGAKKGRVKQMDLGGRCCTIILPLNRKQRHSQMKDSASRCSWTERIF